ncbi:MAG: nucleotide-binding enzyme [Deltaproteobacteria bacterium]|nr:nucleotide-binding enzyme [Deltaproteobacteria bacterium]
MGVNRYGGVRALVTLEAARVMYEEGVKQYFTAKRIAARRVLGHREARQSHYRPSELPSNGEIREALLALADLAEGSSRGRLLFVMRVRALEAMEAMSAFAPRLIGSVATGHIRRGSDIDIQLFTDDPDGPELRARELGWDATPERVSIRKGGEIREYLHLHVVDQFAIEFTVYPAHDVRERPRSSTDGKPIARKSISALHAILERDHDEAWAHYQRDGTLLDLTAQDLDDEAPGAFDGLLEDLDESAPEDCVPTDEERAWLEGTADYDPLPGFEIA